MNNPSLEALFILHQGLPRGGPGSDDCTREALRRLPPLPPNPVVCDLGCGPGRQALVLAQELKTPIIAVDRHAPFLEQLKHSAASEGLTPWIIPLLGDIGSLDIAPKSVDLIWSEGAAYYLGFENALRTWRAWLAPNGLIALTECTWLTETPHEAAKTFWDAGYPAMGTLDENRRRAELAGFDVLDTFVLPADAWWDDFYTPLIARMALLRPTASPDLISLLDEMEREIDLFRHYAEIYGYVFYLLRATRPL